jgi:hypothetical protein
MALYSPMYMISRRPAPIETVSSQLGGPGGGADRYANTDGERILEIFHVQDMAYELEDPTAGMRTLYENMRKQKLDVAQHVPIHGRVGTNDEFLKIVGHPGAQSH